MPRLLVARLVLLFAAVASVAVFFLALAGVVPRSVASLALLAAAMLLLSLNVLRRADQQRSWSAVGLAADLALPVLIGALGILWLIATDSVDGIFYVSASLVSVVVLVALWLRARRAQVGLISPEERGDSTA